MGTNPIRFAFAVNQFNDFESENFCNSDKFHIYELSGNDFVYKSEIVNNFKSPIRIPADSSDGNYIEIIDLLKNQNINVVVSSIFGKNIQMVNSHFIPVVVSSGTPAEVITAIGKHVKWIEDELVNRPEEFKLFTIKKGILKTSVKHYV